MFGLIWIGLFCTIFYYYCIRPISYWKKRGVKQGNPVWLFGDNFYNLLRRESFQESVKRWYREHPNERYSGIYQMMLPILIIRDPELIKQITVKDFEHFVDHRALGPEDADPLWSRNLFTIKGKKWQKMRSLLSPCFTSSKMKSMFLFMCEVAEAISTHLKNQGNETLEVELKQIVHKYTNDLIASIVFGVKVDSLNEPNNKFLAMGKELTDFTGLWKMLKFFCYTMVPKLFAFLNLSLFSKDVSEFFLQIVNETTRVREEKGIIRQDLIHLLLEARKGDSKTEISNIDTEFTTVEKAKDCIFEKRDITNIDIAANALVFFFAGFDSVATTISLMVYELAVNSDIQKRLRDEIDEAHRYCKGELTYETLMNMKYMDMVLSETLRKWSVGVATDRQCTKPYTIEPVRPNEKPLELRKGDLLIIPISGILHDPQYFPEPEKFDPERFSNENKFKIKPFTNLTFGVGPRNCIGSRFAMLECKTMVYYLLLNFEVVPIKKTNIPLKLAKSSITVRAQNGIWLGLKPISKFPTN